MEDQRSPKKLILASFVAALFLLLGFRAGAANAASLYLSPSSGDHSVGQSFTVTVGISSADQAANAISGAVSYPTDLLEATAVSKSGSILGLWVQEPSIAANEVNFAGIALNPGFTGSAGRIMSITFKAKAAGTAAVSLSSGSVLANDGLGTNITSGLGKATFTISGQAAPSAPPETPKPGLPGAVPITSSSHPDINSWYSRNTADLSWALAKGITAVSVFVDGKPATVPTASSDGLFDHYSTKPLDDGVWYFHLRAKNDAGWGPASHYRLQIDTAKPTGLIADIVGLDKTPPVPAVRLAAVDATSGLDRFELSIDGGAAIAVPAAAAAAGPYVLPVQASGSHNVTVAAVDKAGNRASSGAEFTVAPLNKPVIVKYPLQLAAGDAFALSGTSDYPDTPIEIILTGDGGEKVDASVQSDVAGGFAYSIDNGLSAGVYKVWVQVRDKDGAVIVSSDKQTVLVRPLPLFSAIARQMNIWLILLILLCLIVFYLLYRLFTKGMPFLKRNKRSPAKKSWDDPEEFVRHSFKDLRENLSDKIKIMEQSRRDKQLAPLEKKLFGEFKKDIDDLEKNIKKVVDNAKAPKN